MALTDYQLKSLRYDLQELAHIKYTDVLDELLDHYATLTEQKMARGISFNDASKWAWTELGAGKGLQKIQEDFCRTIQHQIQAQHINLLKSYFRWPTVVITVLIGTLVFIITPIIPVKWVIISVVITGLTPALFLLWGYWYGLNKQTDTGQLVWKYVKHKGLLALNLIQLGLNLPNVFLENGSQTTRTFLQAYPGFSAIICLLVLLYTTSFIKLFRYQYNYKFA